MADQYRKTILLLALAFIMTIPTGGAVYAAGNDFSDMPPSHWAYPYVNQLRTLNITNGVGQNRFGTGQTITRAEFVTFLCNLMQWELTPAVTGSFADNHDTGAWYFRYIETALARGAVGGGDALFRPSEPITREEMAVMLVRTLGYDALAQRIGGLGSPFADVTANTGYIAVAKDFGIISGMGDNLFMPSATATREQAATMMIRMYEGVNRHISYKNAFYAISSSGQMDSIGAFDSISFGWSRLTLNNGVLSLNTTAANDNEYRIPTGYETPYQLAAGKPRLLMITADPETAAQTVADEGLRGQAVALMAKVCAEGLTDANGNQLTFDGIVVDIETLRGEAARHGFNALLTALRSALDSQNEPKQLVVAVHPRRRAGQAYYDGYDYQTIGQLADTVILMAHDYNAKRLTSEEMIQGVTDTPLAPIDEIYYALRAITDGTSGVRDKSKIMLQLNFAAAQWKRKDGQTTTAAPYTPSYDALLARIAAGGVTFNYDHNSESPYVTFFNAEDGTENVVWYEDRQSIAAKIRLAEYFGVTGLSLWRLGTIPDAAPEINLNVLALLS